MNGSKNLVLAACTALPMRRLEPFVASLRGTGFAGDIGLLVRDVAAETIRRLRALGVMVERSAPSAQPRMAAKASRYFSYLDFLLRHGERYANVLLIDPSDMVFEADPFATPLPADIVYTATRNRIGDTPAVHDAMVQAYGEAVAHNVRDCVLSNPDTTIATRSGMLRYLTAMTHQVAGRTGPIAGSIDQAIHNYVVHMRPLSGAWLPRTGATVPAPEVPSSGGDAVLAFYLRQRDAGWLHLFLGSLRCVSPSVAVHCIGDFDQDELAILGRYGCTPYVVPATELAIAENVAHFYLSQVLDRVSATATPPGQALLIDNVRAVFPRDPFLGKTLGLSLFCEGPVRIADSGYNRARLELFAPPDEQLLRNPVVSSMVLRGGLPVLREFYRRMFLELTGRAELLKVHKVVQGVVNKLCHTGQPGFPVTAWPNGAEVYFDFLGSDLAIDTRHGVHIGGAVPGVVLADHPETPLMLKLRIDLNLGEDGTHV
ncbi:MAG TPA: hypothetical protein VH855_05125 [Acetobacteraceae bacterium]